MDNYNDNNEERNAVEPVAIIGMNGRFPGAKNVEAFWHNLYNGVESVQFFSRDELIKNGIDEHLLHNPKFVAADAVLEDMDKFDASFFGYSAREAEIMDPQHRIFLECAWEVMESAGYNSELYDGRVSVFAGSALSGYMIRNLYSNPGLVEDIGTFKIMISNSQDFLATRVSYKMDFTGQSINVNTLCSSALVSVHMACQNLLEYSSDIAIAGGVSFQVSRNEAFFYQEGGIGSSDGHCRAYDSKANGTTSGSGLAMVVLKRLEDAIEDGDYIHGVIIGSAVNNDGAQKNSYTAPNADGQAECIAEAIGMADINPETISYIEGHGTGTNLGDPIEITGLTKAFRSYTNKNQFCAIGSVKTNIGHLVSAGGVASLIKSTLALQNKVIPPSLNFEEPNPKIDFVNSPFYVNKKLSKWETEGYPLRSGVSSFGIGGTNAHVIVEEAPKREESQKSNRPYKLVCLSAKTKTALENMTNNLLEYSKVNPDVLIEDVSFTLHVGRKNFNNRRMIVCSDMKDLTEKLQKMNPEQVITRSQKAKEQAVVFMFSGEGSINGYVGQELYKTDSIFKNNVDSCADIIEEILDIDIRKGIFQKDSEIEWSNEKLKQSNIERAVLFTIQYALANTWMELEVIPQFMIGQGVGEYICACIAGVFSLEDALKFILTEEQSLLQIKNSIELKTPQIQFISQSTGDWITSQEAEDIEYWTKKQRQGARFTDGLKEVLKDSDQLLLDLGLGGIIKKEIDKIGIESYQLISSIETTENIKSSSKIFMKSLGTFYLAGGRINWFKFYQDEKRYRMPLPTYPFERQRYWIEPGNANKEQQETTKSDLKKLPRPNMDTELVKPRNKTEKLISNAWSDALGYAPIGVHDDFFELGGHSLIVSAIATDLGKIFDVYIPLGELYEASTIEEVAKLIEVYQMLDEAEKKSAATVEEIEVGTL